MQTFLPYSDIKLSLKCLDDKRLGKQRVEAYQIISAITGRPKLDGSTYKGWVNHPCTIMWRNNLNLLKYYLNCCIDEWVNRGFNNTMEKEIITDELIYPSWFGNSEFHNSHKSNLLRKNYEFYCKFNWDVTSEEPYIWKDKEDKWYKQHAGTRERIYLQ